MSTVTASASVRFIVAMSGNAGQNWRKVGFATLSNNRVKLDDATISTFSRETRINEDIRKACRWLNDESAVSCDMPWRSLLVRVIQIRE
jgi:hypothetical protein